MANVKIPELAPLTSPSPSDLVIVADVSTVNDEVKKTTVGEIVGIITGDVEVATDGTATISELPVSKLQDGAARQLLQTAANGVDVEWTDDVDLPGTLDVTGVTTLDDALNVAGLASLDGGIDVDDAFTVANSTGNIATSGTLDVDGQSTLASAAVSDLTSGRVVLAGASGEIEDSANLTFNGSELGITGTLDVSSNGTIGGDLTVVGLASLDGGIDVDGAFTVADTTGNIFTSGTLGVTGQSTLSSAAVSDLTSGRVVLVGVSGEIEDSANLTFNGSELGVTGTIDVSSNGTIGGDLTVVGDLTVEGATTTLETQTLIVEDKNIELAVVDTPTDTTADGGGITLKGATDKTFNWLDATDAWTSSEHIDLASGKAYYIGGAETLSATALGSAVVSSSLTSVGTLGAGTWEAGTIAVDYGGTGQTAYTDGELLIGTTAGGLAKATITAGDAISVTNGDGSIAIAVSGLTDSEVSASAAIAGTKISPDFGSQNIATTGDIDIDSGLFKVASSTNTIGFYGATPVVQASAIAGITSSATTGSFPPTDGSVTIADAAAPTVTELLEYCVELESKLEAALTALRNLGLIAS